MPGDVPTEGELLRQMETVVAERPAACPVEALALPGGDVAIAGGDSPAADKRGTVTAEWIHPTVWAPFKPNQVSTGRMLTIAVDSVTAPNLLLTVKGPGRRFRCKAWQPQGKLAWVDIKNAHPLGPDCWVGESPCWQTNVRFAPNGPRGNYSLQLCHAGSGDVVATHAYIFENSPHEAAAKQRVLLWPP